MANMTISFIATAGTVASTGPTLNASQETRYSDWAWKTFPQLNPDGSTKPKNNSNIALAIKDHHAQLWQGIVDAVKQDERITAYEAALATVVELPGGVT